MSEPSLYAARLREGMKQHPRGPLTIDDLRQALGRSYQHYWRILNGEPVISRQLNDQLCHFLELRPDEMWAIAEADMAARR